MIDGDSALDGQESRANLARFNPDGNLDTVFTPRTTGNVHSLSVQAGGKIVVCGNFTSISGQERKHIARLSAFYRCCTKPLVIEEKRVAAKNLIFSWWNKKGAN